MNGGVVTAMPDSSSPMKTFLRAELSRSWGTTKVVLLKIGILLAYCGGPLLVTEHIKPVLQMPLSFAKGQLIAAGDRWIDASVTANVKSRRRARLRWIRTR